MSSREPFWRRYQRFFRPDRDEELRYHLESLVYDITVRDTVSYLTALLVLLATLAVATLWPARRALRLNPMDVIRAD
jgi:ABC-type lipoprotein release transport system permease subunit